MAETRGETRKVRWGVIGATARIAHNALIPAILSSEHAELAAVASRRLDSAQEIAANAGPEVAAYGDYDSLIADGNVDVIYLPLPNNLHLGWAVEAMNNGKHVLCEKPLALNADQAQEMVETAEANGVILSEAFMYRYHPLQQEVASLVRGGALGDIQLVRASFSFVQTNEDDYRRDPGMG
ncbi:MAG: Gfo/Idh/MocA family oxidoreductase, partial [Armatimonadota bacterium]|nr:Gfo/Idh/MocA family oxidoreductase [Armatimonadota bacterium]